MAYDEGLAQRVSEVLADQIGLDEKKMFGSVGYMLRGNLACGVHGDELIVRVGPDAYEDALALEHARPFDMTGRPMKGWVFVAQAGFEDDDDLQAWIGRGVAFVLSLPSK